LEPARRADAREHAQIAELGIASPAVAAGGAAEKGVDGHVRACTRSITALNHSRYLVARHHPEGRLELAPEEVQVAAANARRRYPEERFARPRRGLRARLDGEPALVGPRSSSHEQGL
jgi:hypothetical protein